MRLFDANQPVAHARGLEGHGEDRQAGPARGHRGGRPGRHAPQASRPRSSRPDPLVAPFAKGQQVGTLKISSGDQPLREVPLVALEPVEQAGVLGRAWDAIRLWIK